MSKRTKVILIAVAVAVTAYLAYRWWQNRQTNSTGESLGANLNSVAPSLVSGSTGPDSGLNYTGGTTVVELPPGNGEPQQDNPPPQEGEPIRQKKPGNPVHAKSPIPRKVHPPKRPVRDKGPVKR